MDDRDLPTNRDRASGASRPSRQMRLLAAAHSRNMARSRNNTTYTDTGSSIRHSRPEVRAYQAGAARKL